MGEAASRARQEAQFLEVIFGTDALEENDDLTILIWTKPGQHHANDSLFFRSTLEAGDFCRAHRDKRDIYFGLGFRDTSLDRAHRGKEAQVKGVPGFAADFDIKSASSKKNLFESRDEIIDLLSGLRNEPTMTVISGQGVHAYWLFHEPWIFESQDDFESARRMSLGWQRHIRDRTERDIDSTHTLDRVWRVVGTYNHKTDPPSIVETLDVDDFRRYEPDDAFGMFSATSDQVSSAGKIGEVLTLTVDRNAPIPEKVKNLIANSEEFARLWHQIRKMPSQSEYDMAIANVARDAGWSVEEALSAIVSNRRMKSGDMKYGHDRYYALTITNVYGVDVETKESDKPAKALDGFAKQVGLPIQEILRYGQTTTGQRGVTFYIKLKDGTEIRVGNIIDFRKQTVWRDLKALHNPVGQYKAVSKKSFDNLVDSTMPHVKDKTMVDEQTDTWFLSTLDSYLGSLGGADLTGKTDTEKSSITLRGEPYVADQFWWFTRAHFIKWCREQGETMIMSDLSHKLRRAGIRRKTVYAQQEGGRSTSKSYYHVRCDILRDKLKEMLKEREEDE